MSRISVGYSKRPFIWQDPRSKMFLFLAANVALWGRAPLIGEIGLLLFLGLLLVNGKQYTTTVKFICMYLIFLVIDYMAFSTGNGFFLMVGAGVRIFRMYFPIFMSALLLIRTTTVSEFVAAFNKMKIPEQIIIPFSVMFRFFPTLHEEWHNIRMAMKLRGIAVTFKSVLKAPLKTIEYILVPLMISSAKTASELSAASLARGLSLKHKRTCLTEIRYGLLDYLVTLVSLGTIALVFMSRELL